MADKRNIASLVRNHGSFSSGDGIGSIHPVVLDAIDLLYPNERDPLHAQQGIWRIHERTGFFPPHFLEEDMRPLPNEFCAVYERKFHGSNVARTLFSGSLRDYNLIEPTAHVLSEKVLEQGRFLTWPPRKLTAEDGRDYVGSRSVLGMYAPIPLFALELLVWNYGRKTQSFEYNGLSHQILKSLINGNMNPGLMLFGAYYVALVSAGLGARPIGKKLGEAADHYRVKGLPPQALDFKYGPEAQRSILDTYITVQEELTMARIHKELSDNGISITTTDFARVYEAFEQLYRDRKVVETWGTGQKIPLEVVGKHMAQATLMKQ